MKIYRNSKNLLNPEIIENGYTLNYSTGLPDNEPTRIATISPISLEGIRNITVTYTSEISELYFMYALFNNDTLIERVTQKYSGNSIFVYSGNQIYFSFYKTGTTISKNDVSQIMINVGTQPLSYEPYNVVDWYGYKYKLRSSGAWSEQDDKKAPWT